MWVYIITTKMKDDYSAVERVLGTEYDHGLLTEVKPPTNFSNPDVDYHKLHRFETDHELPDIVKDRLKNGSPGMAGFTEYSDEPEWRTASRFSHSLASDRW